MPEMVKEVVIYDQSIRSEDPQVILFMNLKEVPFTKAIRNAQMTGTGIIVKLNSD
jgi:hypothetical protein